MSAIPVPSLWRPPGIASPHKSAAWWTKHLRGLRNRLAIFTAGKEQRNASGRVPRNPSTGKVKNNSDTNTTCCCGSTSAGCANCTSTPGSVLLTFAGGSPTSDCACSGGAEYLEITGISSMDGLSFCVPNGVAATTEGICAGGASCVFSTSADYTLNLRNCSDDSIIASYNPMWIYAAVCAGFWDIRAYFITVDGFGNWTYYPAFAAQSAITGGDCLSSFTVASNRATCSMGTPGDLPLCPCSSTVPAEGGAYIYYGGSVTATPNGC